MMGFHRVHDEPSLGRSQRARCGRDRPRGKTVRKAIAGTAPQFMFNQLAKVGKPKR
jgi:hypothetical protein